MKRIRIALLFASIAFAPVLFAATPAAEPGWPSDLHTGWNWTSSQSCTTTEGNALHRSVYRTYDPRSGRVEGEFSFIAKNGLVVYQLERRMNVERGIYKGDAYVKTGAGWMRYDWNTGELTEIELAITNSISLNNSQFAACLIGN